MSRYSSIRLKPADLFKHKAFQKLKSRPDCDKLVNYILWLYHKDSELIQEYQNDLKARKEEAARDAGYTRQTGGTWPDEIRNVMDIRDHEAFDAIMQLLKIQKHNVWLDIVVTEQELFEYQELRFTPVTKKKRRKKKNGDSDITAEEDKAIIESTVKKGALMKACDERIKKLEGLYEQFFADHKDVQEAEFTESVTPEKAERILALTPPPYEEIREQTPSLSTQDIVLQDNK